MKNKKTLVMGVLNVTPDSFSDGGRFFDREKAATHALSMARDGADIIDIGGESTRPGSKEVSAEEELSRVLPVIEGVAKKLKIPISIDTRKAKVAEAALKAGASIVNDVSGLHGDSAMASVAARYGAKIIIMHMRGTPADMQADPKYDNLIKDILEYLRISADAARRAGVHEGNIVIDPGIGIGGFGKTFEHNLEILNRLDEFKALGYPVCIGTSRKAFIGKALGLPNPEDRLAGSIATASVAIMKGADIIRVHDVKESCQAARMVDDILTAGSS